MAGLLGAALKSQRTGRARQQIGPAVRPVASVTASAVAAGPRYIVCRADVVATHLGASSDMKSIGLPASCLLFGPFVRDAGQRRPGRHRDHLPGRGEEADREPRPGEAADRPRHARRLQGLLPRPPADRPPPELRHAPRHRQRRAGAVPPGRPDEGAARPRRRGQGPHAPDLRHRRQAAERRDPQRQHGGLRAGEVRRRGHPHRGRRPARVDEGRSCRSRRSTSATRRGRCPRRASRRSR